MKLPSLNTRSIVIAGYCLLVILAMTGIVTIYFELIKSHRQSNGNSDFKRELIDLSNTLTTMYQAEGTASLLAFAENDKLKLEYDSLSYRVFDQIDSLRLIATAPDIKLSIDSLSVLLLKKRDNALEMLQLMKQVDKNVLNEIAKRTTVTRSDVDKLNALLADVTKHRIDTVKVIAPKKGFFQRIGDAVKSNTDTLTQISKSSISESSELLVPVLSDTIVQFFKQIDKTIQKKNAEIIQQMLARQHELYIIKELAGIQINKIMDAMKELEYQSSMNLLKDKNESLKRSTSFVAIVGLSALIVTIFFMSWTLQSLNKAQRLQKNIQEANKHAEKLLISREQLIYTITHDIKAPLSSIIGFLDLSMSEDVMLSQKQQYYFHNMHSSASHILELVHNLLDFHSIEKEQLKLTPIAFSPNSLIHSIYESFLPLAQKKNLDFELKSTVPDETIFLSDPYYIRQIVNNLLSNAIKFTPKKDSVSLISLMDEHNRWIILVQDTGPGISVVNQKRIFEEFVRVDKRNERIEGTGLGLPISKHLAFLLGGTIEIESEEGVGSVFTLTIPYLSVAENHVFQQSDTSGKILFVDDDQVQLNLLSELMKKEGWAYICCLSAYEALNVFRENSIAIIFTDINIPGMEGFELVKRIRESDIPQAATIPVIAFSANIQKPEAEFDAAGFNGFLLKPFKAQQLLETIEKYTSFKRKTDKPYSEKDESGWGRIMDFVVDDHEAAIKIIDSFIEETNKNKELLNVALQKKDNKTVKQISHKMLSLVRMVSAQEIISILIDFEKGNISKEKEVTLFHLLEETTKEAEAMRKKLSLT